MQTFTPSEYLMIDIAGQYGLDKETWDTRIEWTKARMAAFGEGEQAEAMLRSLTEDAENPAQFYAAALAFRKAQKGEPTGYTIALDATASGAQLLALLIGCRPSAMLCNVIDTGNREDLYTNVFNLMSAELADATGVTRSDAKRAVMTSLYGSKKEPREVFGEDTPELATFYAVMEKYLGGVWSLNQGLLGLWNPDALSNDWTLPDNFHVHVKVMGESWVNTIFMDQEETIKRIVNMPQEEGRSIGANVVHSIDGMVVREMVRRCDYDQDHYADLADMILNGTYPKTGEVTVNRAKDRQLSEVLTHYAECGFLSARVLDLLDIYNLHTCEVMHQAILNLLKSMPEKPFHVISVHDCFRCHPNYGNDLRRQYNQILSEIGASSLVQYLAQQIAGQPVDDPKIEDLSKDVLSANYALS